MPNFIQYMGEQDPATGEWILSSQRQSIITSLLSAGTFFGALLQSFTSDRLGRRGSIIFWSIIFSVGIIIQVSSFGLAQITVGRFVAGLGVGALSAIVPLYVGEAAPKKLRGALLVLYQVQIASGLFLAYIVDLGTHHLKSSASWRIPVGLQLVWGAFLIVGGLLLPESPRLLLGRGDEKGALKAIARLNDCEVDDPLTRDVIKDLEEAIREENEGGKAGWLECFSTRSMMWKRTLNGCMVQFLQQLNGQNFYYYYGPVFFESADVPLSAYCKSKKSHLFGTLLRLSQLSKPFSAVSPSPQSSPPCGPSSTLGDVNHSFSAPLFKLPVPSSPAWLVITTPMWRVSPIPWSRRVVTF